MLIAPRVVLTAAHCLDLFPGPGAIEVAFADRVRGDAGRWVTVIGGARDPKWDRPARTHDAALLRLAEPVDVPPVAFEAPGPTEADIGQTIRAVGFGVTASANYDTVGTKREGLMRLSEVDALTFRATPAPGLSCEVDSGGPVFLRRDGVDVLLGITISGDTNCATYARHTRVDILADFIKPFIEKTKSAPIGRVAGTIPADALCSNTCNDPAECPGLLPCVSFGSGPGRCQISEPAGDYGRSCRSDAECGSGATCSRLWSSGDDACRCLTPCGNESEPTVHLDRVHAGGGGCATAHQPADPLAWLALLAVLRARRWRQSSRPSS